MELYSLDTNLVCFLLLGAPIFTLALTWHVNKTGWGRWRLLQKPRLDALDIDGHGLSMAMAEAANPLMATHS